MCGRASCTFLVYNTSNSSNTSSNTSTASPNNNNNNDNKKKSIQSIADIQFISNLDLLKSFKPSKNLSPNNLFPIIYNNKNKNQDITIMNWGLKNQNINNMIINSRIETIEETIFKSLLKNNRCVAVIDGFYEFKKVMKDDRDAYFFYFTKNDNEHDINFEDTIAPMKLACLYEEKDGKLSFTILTTASGSSINWCHDRQPVCLNNEDLYNKWLSSSSSLDITSLINDVKNDQVNVEFKSHQCINKVGNSNYQKDDANLPLKSSTKPISNYFCKSPTKNTPIKTENDIITTKNTSIETENGAIKKQNDNKRENKSDIKDILNPDIFISLLDDSDEVEIINETVNTAASSNEVEIISTPENVNATTTTTNDASTIITSLPPVSSLPTSCPLCNISFINFSSYDIKRHGLFCNGGGSDKKRKVQETNKTKNIDNKKAKFKNVHGSMLKFLK